MYLRPLALAVMLTVVAQPAQAEQRTRAPATSAQPTTPAQQGPQNVPQLCRYREAEIVQINRKIAERAAEAARQTTPAATATPATATAIDALRGELVNRENSWQRMGCAEILYANRPVQAAQQPRAPQPQPQATPVPGR